MDHSDFIKDWPHTASHQSSNPPPQPLPQPSQPSQGFLESRLLVFVLIGVIIILVAIVAYLYYSTPKEVVKVVQEESQPHRPRQQKRPSPPPEEPAQVDADGLVRKATEARARRKEEINASRVAAQESVDEDIVTDGAIVTNVSSE